MLAFAIDSNEASLGTACTQIDKPLYRSGLRTGGRCGTYAAISSPFDEDLYTKPAARPTTKRANTAANGVARRSVTTVLL